MLLLPGVGEVLHAQAYPPQKIVPIWRQVVSSVQTSPRDSAYSYVMVSPFSTRHPDTADLLIVEAYKHIGTPYRYGGRGPKTFDCAGFVRYVYAKFGYTLPGGCIMQYRQGTAVKDRKALQRGDLVFFRDRSGHGGVGHVGIVSEVDTATGVFRFIHAATTTGVIYSHSTEEYYAKRYVGARRLLPSRKKGETPVPPKVKRR